MVSEVLRNKENWLDTDPANAKFVDGILLELGIPEVKMTKDLYNRVRTYARERVKDKTVNYRCYLTMGELSSLTISFVEGYLSACGMTLQRLIERINNQDRRQ